jgi:hypothetical protein
MLNLAQSSLRLQPKPAGKRIPSVMAGGGILLHFVPENAPAVSFHGMGESGKDEKWGSRDDRH